MARYIDADKAVEEARLSYCKDCNSYNGVRCSACGFDDAMTYIEDAPTADVVEMKHGKWIIAEECKIPLSHGYIRTEKTYICPFCNHHFRKKMKFCGECGAKMD